MKWILSFVVDAEPAAQWAGAAATWTPSFMLLPALSRAETVRKGQAKPECCPWPSSFSMKNKSTSRSLLPPVRSPHCRSPYGHRYVVRRQLAFGRLYPALPSSSLSFSGLGSIPLSERRQAFWNSPFGAPGLFWFEHRLKHSWKGPSYAMRSKMKKRNGRERAASSGRLYRRLIPIY